MSHHGEPDTEEEVIVLEEPESRDTEGPRVLRAPRAPTQKEIDEHNVAHIPHEEWCEFCMAGRGRNKPHRQKIPKPDEADSEEEHQHGPVPRVCIDYFYVSCRKAKAEKGPHSMSTRELQRKLTEMGKSASGPRHALVRRYQQHASAEDLEGSTTPRGVDAREEDAANPNGTRPHASENPMMVMVDESTGNKYMRAVDHKGLGPDGDNSWLVKDMHQELKSWGHPGGGRNQLILKATVSLP